MEKASVEILSLIAQWVVAPIGAFVWLLYQKQQAHTTAIAVLQAESLTARTAHDREIKEIRETTRVNMTKLDSIEEALRK